MGLINFLVFLRCSSLAPLPVVVVLFVLCARLKHPFDFSAVARNEYLCRLDRLVFLVAAFDGLWLSID